MADGMAHSATLTVLGSFSLSDASGNRIAIRSRKNRALLAVLALSPHQMTTRERVAGLLWGNHGEDQARGSLRQSLAMLRKDLPADSRLVQTRDEFLVLQPGVEVDALELLGGARSHDLDRLRRAALFCQGELLADLSLNEESFEDWIRSEKARLKEAALNVLDRLSDLETGPSRIAAMRRLLQLDPLRESSHRKLMRLHAENGDIGLALKQYDICRALLRNEMQAEPAPETQALRREIAGGAAKPAPGSETEPPRIRAINPQLPDRPSIAVLPFDNASSDPDQSFFSDGISEELIANLSRFRRLFVIARASSFALRGKSGSVRDTGQKLGVRFLLHGSVRRAGDRLRVTAELVEAASEAVLWVEKYDRPAGNIFGVIDELSSTIVASIVGRLEDEMLRQARRKPTDSLAAYELVLRGRALTHDLKREDQPTARRLFEEAIRLDGNYAMAHAQLAYTWLYEFFWDDSGAALRRAADIAFEALQIDEEEAWCHMVLGLSYLHQRKFDLAIKHCERAVLINPNDPDLAAKLGLVLTDAGRHAEAIALIEKAMRLSPLHPEAFSDYLALALMGDRRYQAAIEVLKAAPQPTYYYHAWLAVCYACLGNLETARQHGARTMELEPDFTLARVAAREPLRDPADLARWVEALGKAGIPP